MVEAFSRKQTLSDNVVSILNIPVAEVAVGIVDND
jgi:hypothetical protein